MPCENCEMLRSLLEQERYNNRKLLDSLLEVVKPSVVASERSEPPKPIMPKNIPWSVRQQMLEQESRITAQLLKQKSIENLEEELGVSDALSTGDGEVQAS